jgi:hypothetical protein
MKRVFLKVCTITALMLNLTLAHAAFLSFTESETDSITTLEVGETVSLSFGIFDLADTEDLAGYNINLAISGASALLNSAISIAPSIFDSSPVTDTSNAINLLGFSFAFDFSNQADGFLLGEFVFTAASLGSTTISVSDAELSDPFGFSLASSGYSATINVIDPSIPQVSAPPIAVLAPFLALALICRERFGS